MPTMNVVLHWHRCVVKICRVTIFKFQSMMRLALGVTWHFGMNLNVAFLWKRLKPCKLVLRLKNLLRHFAVSCASQCGGAICFCVEMLRILCRQLAPRG